MVLKDGKPVPSTPTTKRSGRRATCWWTPKINGIQVKSVPADLTTRPPAPDRWPSGPKLAGSKHRTSGGGPGIHQPRQEGRGRHPPRRAQHTNGFYNVLAWMTLNLLIGNYDWKGGMAKATTYNISGDKEGKPFDFGKMMPDKIKPFGIASSATSTNTRRPPSSTGIPAKRIW